MAQPVPVWDHLPVTLVYVLAFVVLAAVLYATSGKPGRWLERRYWRRRREQQHSS